MWGYVIQCPSNIFGSFYWNHFGGVHLTKCQTGPTSHLGEVHLTKCHFIRWPTSQSASLPAATGQPTNHLTKCQPDPKSHPRGEYIWLNVNLTIHLIWPNVKLVLCLILGGGFVCHAMSLHSLSIPSIPDKNM